jgi:hypothetical protein
VARQEAVAIEQRMFFCVGLDVAQPVSGSGHLPAEHRDLVPQHQQLHVVGGRAPGQQHQPSQQLAEHQIEQSKRHPSSICASVSLSEVAAQSLRPTFWHPQVDVLVGMEYRDRIEAGSRLPRRPSVAGL